MSVFRVNLNNGDQGKLDIDPTAGTQFSTSKQRTVYVMGPGRINRKLVDGTTFSDCNYWKRFSYPTTTRENAFISIVTDDGSVYSDVASDNTFAVTAQLTLSTSFETANNIDFVPTHGGPASFLQIRNTDGSIVITVEVNDSATALFTIAAGATQVFNTGDLAITKIRIKSASGTPACEVVAAVKSVCNS